jgi:DNA topoisomerase I
MSRHLVVVESPAKARTLKKYLGQDYQILASYGHVRDLLPKEGAVDPESGFSMKYEVIGKNAKHVDAIAKAVKQADVLYLATDPDREGEAISWHLHEILRERRLLKDKDVHRVVFHEITRGAIQDAVRHPRDLSMELVNAQQARRALDYLVGFSLSPLLWKKIRRGLSAGRVQSPALRMIVEREQEIDAFVRQEYWTVEALASKEDQGFGAKLVQYRGAKVEQFTITRQDQADTAIAELRAAAAGKLRVEQVERKQRRRQPPPPFTTSTLQQEAARKLGFSADRTMRVAQQLYEGVDVGGDRAGLITYMRTDSVNLAQEAVRDIRTYISERFGESRLPDRPRLYKTKSKNAQEAHEAIRATSVQREPQSVKAHLTADQLKLYDLVWRRAVACQMMHATINTVAVDLACGSAASLFRATGSTVADAGYLAVYEEGRDDAQAEEENLPIPPLAVGDLVDLIDIVGRQHFTEPPPRYSEATLIKALEEYGIGRPSTYAAIISTLLQREYAVLEKRRFRPTDVGRIVNRFLTQHFAPYVDYEFTARLEDELDEVSRGEKQWVPLLREFWSPFKRLVDSKEETVSRREVTHEVLDELCPKCGSPLSIRLGRHGRFVGCTAYPDCNYTRNLDGDKAPTETEVVQGRTCPECGGELHVKRGRYGAFIGCSNYPRCRHIEPLEKPADTGVQCPQCRSGTLLRRRSRRGKVFFSCSSYPKCTYAVWNEPVSKTCPKCGWPILTIRNTKRRGEELVCPQKECGYAEPLDVRVAAVS